MRGAIRYFKVSGAGNDFLALVNPERSPAAAEVRAWCRRGLSLGADGVFVLTRSADGVAMDYRNADGEPAELCLNGTRCAARLAERLGWAPGGAVRVLTGAGPMPCRVLPDLRVAVTVPAPASPPREVALAAAGTTWSGWRVDVGVPHLVLFWPENLETAPVATLGPVLRRHPDLGAEGANVDFVRRTAAGQIGLRTFERGIEAETLACGTGALAAAAAEVAAHGAELPLAVTTRGGFTLTVDGSTTGGRVDSWSLAGDARILAAGEILAEAAR